MARRRARSRRRAGACPRSGAGSGGLARRHDLRAYGRAAAPAVGTGDAVDVPAGRGSVQGRARCLQLRGRPDVRAGKDGRGRDRDADPARAGRTCRRISLSPTWERMLEGFVERRAGALRARGARPPGRLHGDAARAGGARRHGVDPSLVRRARRTAGRALPACARRLRGLAARRRRRGARRGCGGRRHALEARLETVLALAGRGGSDAELAIAVLATAGATRF